MRDLVTSVHHKCQLSPATFIVSIEHGPELITDDGIKTTDQFFKINWCRIPALFEPGLSKCLNESARTFGYIEGYSQG